MTDKQFNEVNAKLALLIRLTALLLAGDKKQEEKIQVLSQAGFQPKEIAELIGTTPNTVRVSRSKMRKGKRE